MPTVRVEQVVGVSRDALFAVLTDHEGYGRFPGVHLLVGDDIRTKAYNLHRNLEEERVSLIETVAAA